MKFPWCFKKVSSVLQKSFWCGSLRGVLKAFQAFFKKLARMFHASFIKRKFQECSKKVLGVFQECCEGVFCEFQRYFKEVLRMI